MDCSLNQALFQSLYLKASVTVIFPSYIFHSVKLFTALTFYSIDPSLKERVLN